MRKSEAVDRQKNRRANWSANEIPDQDGRSKRTEAPPRQQNRRFRILILVVAGKVNSEE